MAVPRRVLIMGAAGRDFHNFNVIFRDDPSVQVVAFTATQIPGIETRKYPASLAGSRYPDGIPIFPEEDLVKLIPKLAVETCVFSYSDVDYEKILRQAEGEAEVLLWDGGNNDTPFFRPNLHIVVADPLRAGHELAYYPGETNLRMADVVIINKVDSATPESVETVKQNTRNVNPDVVIVEAASPITTDEAALIRGKAVLAIEDGPTLTHGGMEYGAAYLAAQRFGASEIVSAVGHAVGSIKETYKKYPNSRKVMPAMGYGPKQIKELLETIDATPCDVVVSGTPIDLSRVLKTKKPVVHVRYELDEIGHPNLEDVLRDWDFI